MCVCVSCAHACLCSCVYFVGGCAWTSDIIIQCFCLTSVPLFQSLEANKVLTLINKLSKIEEASKKKDEQENIFVTQTREALDQKMESHIEKREAYLGDLKAKLKDHVCISQSSSFCLWIGFKLWNVWLKWWSGLLYRRIFSHVALNTERWWFRG